MVVPSGAARATTATRDRTACAWARFDHDRLIRQPAQLIIDKPRPQMDIAPAVQPRSMVIGRPLSRASAGAAAAADGPQ